MNDTMHPRKYLGVHERREQLLDAALGVVRDGGPAALSLRTVAQRAGVAHRVVSYAFGTMAELTGALLRRESARAVDLAWSAPLAAEPLAQAVAGALRRHLADVRDDPRRYECLVELTLFARSQETLATAARDEARDVRSAIGARLEEWTKLRHEQLAVPTEVVVSGIHAAADGLVGWWLEARDDAQADMVLTLLAGGFASATVPPAPGK